MKHLKPTITAALSALLLMTGAAFAMDGYRHMNDMDNQEQYHEQEPHQEQETNHNGYDYQDDSQNPDAMNDDMNGGMDDQNEHQDSGPQNHEGHDMRHSSGPQFYNRVNVDMSGDLFVNADVFNSKLGGLLPFVDDNGDGIVDYAQDTPHFRNLGIGPFQDQNGDSIHDGFETYGFYRLAGMSNFVDVDGDGMCDNYEADPFSHESSQNRWMGSGQRSYDSFSVDTDADLFVNADTFNRMTGGRLEFVDNNVDGVCDYFQDTPEFASLGMGQFVDQNEDSIHDAFETYEFYRALGMNNFVDVDGDGICDNYEADPVDMM